MRELHLILLWERARHKQEEILSDIRDSFTIHRIYEISWKQQFVSKNFTRFYGQNLPDGSVKERECGTGPFLLVVLFDEHPQYESRDTYRGPEIVNVNLFDKKSLYRKMTGGGHKIHATNSLTETNHDITLLLGKNVNDFLSLNKNAWDGRIQKIERDIIGTPQWNDVMELFYVLNNTIQYVILRGANALMDNSFSVEHRDIDLLLDNIPNAQYIINGQSVFSEFRPHELVLIRGKEYFLDLWSKDRNYFDARWQKEMLESRVFQSFFYVLNNDISFYVLLYHCLIIKGRIADDYRFLLEKYRREHSLYGTWENLLTGYLSKYNYSITLPHDNSVSLHLCNEEIQAYVEREGVLLKTFNIVVGEKEFFSQVFEKKTSFVKKGTPFLIYNEYKCLERLSSHSKFPRVIRIGADKSIIEITRVLGQNPQNFFSEKVHKTSDYIRSFMLECINILSILVKHNLVHRDFTPDNLLVMDNDGQCEVSLIDFGWAVEIEELRTAIRPEWLGHTYAPLKDSSDFYSLGEIFIEMWPDIPFVARVAKLMMTIKSEQYSDRHLLQVVIDKANSEIRRKNYLKDFGYYIGLGIRLIYELLVKKLPIVRKIRIFVYNKQICK